MSLFLGSGGYSQGEPGGAEPGGARASQEEAWEARKSHGGARRIQEEVGGARGKQEGTMRSQGEPGEGGGREDLQGGREAGSEGGREGGRNCREGVRGRQGGRDREGRERGRGQGPGARGQGQGPGLKASPLSPSLSSSMAHEGPCPIAYQLPSEQFSAARCWLWLSARCWLWLSQSCNDRSNRKSSAWLPSAPPGSSWFPLTPVQGPFGLPSGSPPGFSETPSNHLNWNA